MNQKKYFLILLVTVLLVAVFGFGGVAVAGEIKTVTFEHGGYNRSYDYYIPSGYDGSTAVPMVLSFHGLGSNPSGQQLLTKFNYLAEQEGFIVVFPNSTVLEGSHPNLPALPGSNKQWNVGVDRSLQYFEGVDDVGFVEAIIDRLSSEYKIDGDRIFATGMSNGAMFSYYLAVKLPDRIAGIAAVTAPMTVNILDESAQPATIIIMMGTEDPIVPYDGVEGFITSIDETVSFWLDVNGITAEPEVEYLPQTAEDDSTRIKRTIYAGGIDGTAVILYTVEGGGHTWPGGPQYFPAEAIGPVSYHMDGSAVIWEDLMEYCREARADMNWVYYAGAGVLLLVIIVAVLLGVRKKNQAGSA